MIPKETNRPTKQICIPSLRLQKQLPENPFIHRQLSILLMTLLMKTFHWLAKVQTLSSILLIFLGKVGGNAVFFSVYRRKSSIKLAVIHQNVWDYGQPESAAVFVYTDKLSLPESGELSSKQMYWVSDNNTKANFSRADVLRHFIRDTIWG